MDKHEEQYNLIQQYLDGKMSVTEETSFEHNLKADTELMNQFQFECDLRESLSLKDFKKNFSEFYMEDILPEFPDVELKKQIEQANNERNNKKIEKTVVEKVKIVSFKKWLPMAAAACILVAIISAIWVVQQKPPTSIVAKNDSDTSSKRSDSNVTIANTVKKDTPSIVPQNSANNFAAAFKKFFVQDDVPDEAPLILAGTLAEFKNKHYQPLQQYDEENIPSTRGIDDDEDKLNSEENIKELLHYYKGLSYIETNNTEKAKQNFLWVINKAKNNDLVVKAQWYLALTYVRDSDTTKVIVLLNQLVNTKPNPYKLKAKELQKALKE